MLKIGEFSKLSRVSVRMLRHYDEVGLLAPSEVDPMTGYRYYSERQLITAGRIAALRALGFGLSDTRELLRLYDDRAALDACLAAQRTRLEVLAADTAQKLRLLDTARERLRKEADMNYNVTIKTLPARYAACVRMTIPCYEAEGMVWDVLCRETDHMPLVPDDPCYCSVTFLDEEYKERDVLIEASKTVRGRYHDMSTSGSGRCRPSRMPAACFAAATRRSATSSRLSRRGSRPTATRAPGRCSTSTTSARMRRKTPTNS